MQPVAPQIRRAAERGFADHGWLKSFHTFSFADYFDPKHMGFRQLRVINDDWVAAGQGFGEHPHRDMEIVTYMLEGAIQHRDSMGNSYVLKAGEVQRMSAGTGVQHSEFNASKTAPLRLLQIWILPKRKGLPPSYEQKDFSRSSKLNQLCLIAAPGAPDGAVDIHQNARLLAGILEPGKKLTFAPSQHAAFWIQVARGNGLNVNGALLATGDGASLSTDQPITFEASQDETEFLLFELH